MPKDVVFKLTLEPGLLADFVAAAAGEGQPASQVMRGLMRDYIQERRQGRDFHAYLQTKVEAGRVSMRCGHGHSNEEVEADFALRRAKAAANRA